MPLNQRGGGSPCDRATLNGLPRTFPMGMSPVALSTSTSNSNGDPSDSPPVIRSKVTGPISAGGKISTVRLPVADMAFLGRG